MIEAYLIHFVILIGIYLILAIALQISLGFTGILNMGHISFFAIGAYTSALLTLNGFPFLLAFVMAGVLAMIFGFLLSVPISKLKGDYLALVSMGFSFVIYAVIINWSELTKGPLGLPGIPKPILFGISFSDNFSFMILTLVITLTSFVIVKKITSSGFGKVLEAIRDDELATKILGKDTTRMKSISLGVSTFFAGISGSLYAHYITFIDPSSFTTFQIVPILCIILIGGLASIEGTVVATIVVTILPESLRFLQFSPSIVGPMRQVIYSLILLLILIYKPKGFYGNVEML